jgi:hypothetical protein
MLRIYKTSAVLSALMKVGTFYFRVMLVLQSCTDPLQVLPGSSFGTFPSSSDVTYDIGNIKFGEVIYIKEEEKLKVKAEKGVDSEEEECIDIRDEHIHNVEEEEDVDIKEEVSSGDTV